jgi:hypothetical protein
VDLSNKSVHPPLDELRTIAHHGKVISIEVAATGRRTKAGDGVFPLKLAITSIRLLLEVTNVHKNKFRPNERKQRWQCGTIHHTRIKRIRRKNTGLKKRFLN